MCMSIILETIKNITTESRECNNVNKISIHSVLTTCN